MTGRSGAPPRVVGDRYEVRAHLGEGGFATVYRAFDRQFGREVAIKMLRADAIPAGALDRFLREVRLASKLEHPHIVHVYDEGQWEGVPYFVMELVAGRTLEERLKTEGALPLDDAITVTTQVGEALLHAHGRNVVHRDVKPANILLGAGGAHLSDFGIARALGEVTQGGHVTSAGVAVGTVPYMSPEQLCADPTIDARTDQYSLALVCYEMLTGTRPHDTTRVDALRSVRMMGATHPPSTRRTAVPAHVDAAVMRALAPTPADRFRDVGEFLFALTGRSSAEQRAVGMSGSEWRRPSGAMSMPGVVAPVRRVPRWAVAGLVGAGMVGVALVARVWSASPDVAEGVSIALEASGDGPSRELSDRLRAELAGFSDVSVLDSTVGDLSRASHRLRVTREVLGDSTVLRVARIDDRREEADRVRVIVPAGGWASSRAIRPLLIRAVIGPALDSMPGADRIEVTNIAAVQTLLDGWRAVQRGAFDSAATMFADADAKAPGFALALLWKAQALQWQSPKQAELWREPAQRALAARPSLTGADSAVAAALAAMATDDPPGACGHYRKAIEQRPEWFVAWYGLGDCQRYDSIVVMTPKGARFRSSHWGALRAYQTSLRGIGLARVGSLVERVIPVTYATGRHSRRGVDVGAARTSYFALPTLTGDSFSFIPVAADAFLSMRPGSVPATLSRATMVARQQLLVLTSVWLDADSLNVSAWIAHARALEYSGAVGGSNPRLSAAGALARAQALAGATRLPLVLGIAQVRLMVRRGQGDSAVMLAHQLASRPTTSPDTAALLASLAVFSGDRRVAVSLLYLAASESSTRSTMPAWAAAEGLPASVADSLRAVTIDVSLGVCEGLSERVRRVEVALADALSPIELEQRRRSLLRTAALAAVPCIGTGQLASLGVETAIDSALVAAGRGDRRTTKLRLGALTSTRLGSASAAISAESAILEGWAWMQIGDTVRAVETLARSRRSLADASDLSLDEIHVAAAIAHLVRQTAQPTGVPK